MSGGGKGGSQTTTVKIPEWLETAAQGNLAKANELAQIGYTPYYGPDVAAMTPAQIAAGQNIGSAASAFGLSGFDPTAGMPTATTYANGVSGYSSAPLYQQSLAALQAAAPGQYAALQAPFINPVTGAAPAAPYGTAAAPQAAQTAAPASGLLTMGGSDHDWRGSADSGFDWGGYRASNEYDPYNDPQVVGLGTAMKNSAKDIGTSARNSMGSGK